ncbi:MAG: asparagine synthase (glutamine-hydrolyzing) [Candidatus Binatus sp.]
MCGICGIVSTDHSAIIEPAVICRMRDTLAHRGPDDKGVYLAPGVALGHRRLSIIDLRPEGRQPMANEDGTVRIVFNGEIYNFAEHYEWLIARGHRFRSRTDTEVIVHLYEELGVRCLERLRGMFAFAIWDARKRCLFLARDRFGKKPLFYCFDGKRILFASEAKAILTYPGFVREPDPAAIDNYIALGYLPGPRSAFKGIRKLPPAHYLLFTDGEIEIRRYWHLAFTPKLELGEEEACSQIKDQLTEAVRLRMIGDVPIGAFLSGGIDSSSIVALMATLGSGPVKTFSIGFEESAYDETTYARAIARHFGTEHHEFIVRPDGQEMLDRMVWHYDEPFADAAALPTFYLCKLTRESVTVALTGEAGDENFGGYPRYAYNSLVHYLQQKPSSLQRMVRVAAGLGGRLLPDLGGMASKLHKLDAMLGSDAKRGFARSIVRLGSASRRLLYTNEFAERLDADTPEDLIMGAFDDTDGEGLDAALNLDLNLYLPYDLLVKIDIASMAVGLEARAPMVDHEFVEFVARLPTRFKRSRLSTKVVLRKAMKGILPRSILNRPKRGFSVPLDRWFRGQLKDLIRDTLLSRRSTERAYFNRSVIEAMIDAHTSGRADHQNELWGLLMLELWHRVFIDGSAVRPDAGHGAEQSMSNLA